MLIILIYRTFLLYQWKYISFIDREFYIDIHKKIYKNVNKFLDVIVKAAIIVFNTQYIRSRREIGQVNRIRKNYPKI